ncbi:MAG: DNA repair protein RecN [Verrucomicrobia bacterium]|nr:MAG: DNA repair protein RecN [Verrucomicrobiota bacterium]
MLATLRIKNLALVADLTLELQPGYNVITGETGAGKSILIGALNLVLGERAERTLIRSGSEECSVEAVFDITEVKAPVKGFLHEHGLEPCENGQLLLKRSFTAAGQNRQFINGSPTTLSTLKALGEWLVDIHGPHEHQSLLHPGNQLSILDAFGGLEAEREAFAKLVSQRTALEQEKAALIVDEQTYARQLDLLRFQVSEISGARLQPEEEEQLEQDFRRASNAARLLQLSRAALDSLGENDDSLLTRAGAIGRALQELQRTDPASGPLLAQHEQAVAQLSELRSELSRYSSRIEADPGRLQQLEERVNFIQSLKRKYGATVADVIAFGEEAARKLQSLEQRETELARIAAALDQLDTEIQKAGDRLSEHRRKLIPRLSKAVSQQLADLGFKQSRFDIVISSAFENSALVSGKQGRGRTSESTIQHPASCIRQSGGPGGGQSSRSGFDAIEFQFAPNLGEPPRPLRAIASSGELARVMLAIKTVLAAQDQVPVLVFDEVDANVGGETARAVGEKMQQIARKRQVLCITHLPQVAAPASAHYVAAKITKSGRTISEITPLDPKARVSELARMLGGQTDAARRHAQAMLADLEKV